MDKNCLKCKTKVRDEAELRSLVNRLSRIEGQVRGVRGMLENDAYCIDILTQVAAISSALRAFNKELLVNHIRTCVVNDIKNGEGDAVDELVEALATFIK